MKRLFAPIVLAALTVFSLPAGGACSQEAQDQTKVDLYKKFVANRVPHTELAYQAGKEYLDRYGNDKDKYTDYIEKWVALYERWYVKQRILLLIDQKNFAEAFRVGAKSLEVDHHSLQAKILLAYAGYLALVDNDETNSAVALMYAREAIAAIESGKSPRPTPVKAGDPQPNVWAPFKDKDDTLAYLNFSKAVLTLKSDPDESVDALIKAVGYESAIRTTPSTYYFLATAYESGQYKALSDEYQLLFADRPETLEGKGVLAKLNDLMDRIIDGYARAIALTGTDPKTERSRKEWLEQMLVYYKFRNGGSEAGINEFIAGSLERPLPAKP